ncbi:bifunctional diguanylate cyclase/phosphodiesterase [Neptuniibacter marinus]|uniref:bifunctional diguanylate cyclase/phosphodiesterase n=1 Tax=Neptuniibacter marinus TaxID=1806670 RepID=UPI003B5BAF3D
MSDISMRLSDNRKLLFLIRYTSVAIVCVFALVATLAAIQDNRMKAVRSIENLRNELLNQRKELVRSQVNQVYKQLLLRQSKLEATLKSQEKERVYEAYAIAHHIYANNPDKSKSEMTKLISEALRPISFFNGRGYFFILDNQGTVVMDGLNPSLENQSLWNVKDKKGNYFARRLLNIVDAQGEGFLYWTFPKQDGSEDKQFEKLGFVREFEPYRWVIGVSEYIDDFEQDAKKDLLDWFTGYEYGEGGYFVVLDKQGTLLSHHYNDFVGIDLAIGDKLSDTLFGEISKQVEQGGGYVSYQKPLTISGEAALEHISYVREVKGWDWIIGTGFNYKTFEKYLKKKEKALAKYNDQSLIQLIVIAVVAIILLVTVSLYVSHLIARRFEAFQKRIELDFYRLQKVKDQMEHMALHDDLTGLPNRLLLTQKVEASIKYTSEQGGKLAIFFIDIDNFKNVNDLYGHSVGDQLLREISCTFKALITEKDAVCRFGGDEFVFCYSNLKNQEDAHLHAKRIQRALAEPFIIASRIITVSCSIGATLYPDDSKDVGVLISKADTVLYRSKNQRRGQIVFYDESISEYIKYLMNVEHEVVNAITSDEISVCYQPQIDIATKKLVSVEALARWSNSYLGDVPPETFITAAEETGLIHRLGLFVLKKSCEDIYRFSPNGKGAIGLSVNVSPMQVLEPEFSTAVIEICTHIGIDPRRITLEITENIFIHKLDKVLPVFNQLKEQGFSLSLDDFGTGYSSLSYINNLPLSEIKIDRSFINKFLEGGQSDMLVRMIISLGHSCGMTVVAEGVETEEQFEKLVAYQCDLVQGYYFDRPLSIESLMERYST